jgi:ubiquinone/menaquinone biosynthesis C-methylase UbiE
LGDNSVSEDNARTLSRDQARTFYDRFGKSQDLQNFYEHPATNALIAHAQLERANSVFELGCGTGSFADDLLANHLPATAAYTGVDISSKMVSLARQRLEAYGDRAQVVLSDGALRFDYPAGAFDRFIANYVADLLPAGDILEVVQEAYRLLSPDGKLCLVSLTHGNTPISRAVSSLWSRLCTLSPTLVGGCRPVTLERYIDPAGWQISHLSQLSAFGISSQVLVATKKP